MFSRIYNPQSKRMVSLRSRKGMEILHNYLNFSNQMNGGSNSESKDDIDHPSLNDLKIFIEMLEKTNDVVLKQMYDELKSNCDAESLPANVIEKYLEVTKKSYLKGKYYLGGQIKLSPEDIISPEKIQEVKDINATKRVPTNSFEAASIYRSDRELKTIETLINHYIIIKTHIMFRPGGIGMNLAEDEFNTLYNNVGNN